MRTYLSRAVDFLGERLYSVELRMRPFTYFLIGCLLLNVGPVLPALFPATFSPSEAPTKFLPEDTDADDGFDDLRAACHGLSTARLPVIDLSFASLADFSHQGEAPAPLVSRLSKLRI